MLIQRIKNIRKLGLFADWTSPNDLLFGRYNLFYGWNGSGKSTLSRLLRACELKQIPSQFSNLEFEIELSDDTIINQYFSSTYPLIKVFNKDFIQENTSFETGSTKSIIYLGKDNASLKTEIDENKTLLSVAISAQALLVESHQNKTSQRDAFFTNSGGELKAFFLNTMYANNTYDRRNAIRIWDEIKGGASLNDFTMDEFRFGNKQKFIAQGERKEKIEFHLAEYTSDIDGKILEDIRAILKKNPVINTVERLKRNPDIAQWVQHGLGLHKKHNSLSCEFCNQPLPIGKLNTLSDHFNEEFLKLQKEIFKKKQEIEQLLLPPLEINMSFFIQDKVAELTLTVKNLNDFSDGINKSLNKYLQVLSEKEAAPLRVAFSYSYGGGGYIDSYNMEVRTINAIIKLHNTDVDNYETLAHQYRLEIEKHFVAKKAINESFFTLLGEIAQIEQEMTAAEQKVKKIKIIINSKEIELQNDSLAIESINDNLHAFIGRNDIYLEKLEEGGYILKRGNDVALNLSEGERTAIALVYFIAKIKEKDNDLKQTIIVFDDPISSLDSNHLFNVAYFLKNELYSEEEANAKVLQLFILTHNLYFFSMIKEWEHKKNIDVFSILSVNDNGSRKAIIEKADNALAYFSSEYHFLFAQIKAYCELPDKNYYHTHTIANVSRQLLESFLTFKFGRKKLEKCFDEITGFPEIGKVRKFVSHYSHKANHGESIRGFNDNIFAETPAIVPLVLKLIEHVDKVHHDSMINRLNNS